MSPSNTSTVSTSIGSMESIVAQPRPERDSIEHVEVCLATVSSLPRRNSNPFDIANSFDAAPVHRMHWNTPPEIDQNILSFLSASDLVGMKRVSKRFHAAAYSASKTLSMGPQLRKLSAQKISNLSFSSTSDSDFEENITRVINSTFHVGIDLNGIKDSSKREIVLRVLAASTHLVSIDLQAPILDSLGEINHYADDGARLNSMGIPLASLLGLISELNEHHTELLEIHLNLAGVPLGDNGVAILSQFKPLTELNVAGTGLTAQGLEEIANIKSLIEVDISRNPISGSDDSSRDIGLQALASHENLRKVDFSSTAIGDHGAKILAESQTIETLKLTDCNIGNDGAIALATTESPSLKSINLVGNSIDLPTIMTLVRNSAFEELYLPPILPRKTADRTVLDSAMQQDSGRIIRFIRFSRTNLHID